MTDPNDTPALDLDAIDGRLAAYCDGWWQADECADGELFASAPSDLRACVARIRADAARIRADAARIAALTAEVVLADGHVAALQRERDAYKRAKAENDERFMIERDAARRERDEARERIAALETTLALTTENARGFAELHTRGVERLGMMEQQRREANERIAALDAACLDLRRALDGAEEMAARESESIAALKADAIDAAKEHAALGTLADGLIERTAALTAERDAALARVRELEAAALTVADATRAEERERSARVCEAIHRRHEDATPWRCAEEIRSGREP